MKYILTIISAMLLVGCIPMGVSTERVSLAWSEGSAKIECRLMHNNATAFAVPEGRWINTYRERNDYWLLTNGSFVRLKHVTQERKYDTKKQYYNREYSNIILGDLETGRWAQVSYNIISRIEADVFLDIFDSKEVKYRITLPVCKRDISTRRDILSQLSIEYNSEKKAIRFMNSHGEGYVSLSTGTITYSDSKSQEPTTVLVMPAVLGGF